LQPSEHDGATGCSIDGTDATGAYKIVGTTADLAISAIAGTLQGLYATAATGLFSLLADPSSIRPITQRTVTAEAGDQVGLLIAFLNELLFLHESEDWLMASVSITTLSSTRIEAVVAGEAIDPTRHQIQHHIKAVTYHRASIRRTSRGWEATVIVDV
jgi:SHS2 domain-containing protein